MKNIFKYTSVLFLVFSLSSCLEYREVEVIKITNVGIKEISTKAIDIEVAMQIKNPNKYDISIVGSDLMIFLKGKKWEQRLLKKKLSLRKNQTISIALQFNQI
ncbi:MAG: hypothetical protein JKX68_05085 [Flavobacteriales bacterium]|nr:hypothetical protein [Flavobacteriales bacterium]